MILTQRDMKSFLSITSKTNKNFGRFLFVNASKGIAQNCLRIINH